MAAMAGRWQKAILAAVEEQVRRHEQGFSQVASVLLVNVVCGELGVATDAVPAKALSAARRAAHVLEAAGCVSLGRIGGWLDGDRTSLLAVGRPGELEDKRLPKLREQAVEAVVVAVRDVASGGMVGVAQSAWVEQRHVGFELPRGAAWGWWLRRYVAITLANRLGVEPARVRKAVDRALLDAEERGLVEVSRGCRELVGRGRTRRSEVLFVVLSDTAETTQQSGRGRVACERGPGPDRDAKNS